MAVDLNEALYKISFNYVKKEPYTGSMGEQRFKVEKFLESDEVPPKLRLWLWPGPLCFEKTAEEKKELKEYDFSQEGLDMAVSFLMDLQESKQ